VIVYVYAKDTPALPCMPDLTTMVPTGLAKWRCLRFNARNGFKRSVSSAADFIETDSPPREYTTAAP